MVFPRKAPVPRLAAAAASAAAFAASLASAASAAPVIRLEVGPERIVCGVTAPAASHRDAAPGGKAPRAGAPAPGAARPRELGLLLWFHGGMRSQNREKGLEAHRPLLAFADSARFVMASASAFAGRDWLSPATLRTVDALVDTLRALYPLGDDLRLVGVSDGCLGILRYASAGKWRAGRKLLISSLPQAAMTEEQLHPDAHLHFYPEGEHDFSYYATHAAELLRSLLAPSAARPDRKKPKKG